MGFKDEEGLYGPAGRYIMMKKEKVDIIVWAYLYLKSWRKVEILFDSENYRGARITRREIWFVRRNIEITSELKKMLSNHRRKWPFRLKMRSKHPELFGKRNSRIPL